MARDPCENVMVAGLWIRCRWGGLQLLEGKRGLLLLLLAGLCWTNTPWALGGSRETANWNFDLNFFLKKEINDKHFVL